MQIFRNINEWFDQLINRSYFQDREALALYRICYSIYFLIFGFPIYRWIPKNPDIFFDPPQYSIASFYSGFPPIEIFIAIDAILIVLLVALLFGYRTVLTSILLAIFWIIGSSFKFSFSKIDHNIFLILTPFILSMSGWGEKYSIDSKSNRVENSKWEHQKAGLPIFLMALLLGFGYFTAGYAKFFTWMDFDLATHGVRSWVTRAMFVSEKEALLLPYIANITNPYFWDALDIIAVTFEMSFFLAVFNKKVFRTYLILGVVFHFTNMLILYIPFRGMMIIYLLFINWKSVKEMIKRHAAKPIFTFKNMLIVILFYFSIYTISYFVGSNLFSLSIIELTLSPVIQTPAFWITHIFMGVALFIAMSFSFRWLKPKLFTE